jgi:hypothetical protein
VPIMLSPKDVIKKSYLKQKTRDKGFEDFKKNRITNILNNIGYVNTYIINNSCRVYRAACQAFGLNQEACEFLINYDLEFRADV